jgi:choline dehydrogenase-like flavoprotein
MTETFIPRALRAGCRLLPDTRVDRLRRGPRGWVLETRGLPGRVRIRADHVFVSAGAIQTPALLRRSGIRRNIGNSLRFHATVKSVARFPDAIQEERGGVGVHQVKEFSPRISIGCSIGTPAYLALALMDHPEHLSRLDREWERMAVYYAMIRGGAGTIRTLPFAREPLVRVSFGEEDRLDLSDALSKLGEVLFAAGATDVIPCARNLPLMRSPSDLASIPRPLPAGDVIPMTIHLFSSCPMGENRSLCATDSYGRVHGVENLHIADASLLCGAPGVNPQGSIMAIARRNALKFLGKP